MQHAQDFLVTIYNINQEKNTIGEAHTGQLLLKAAAEQPVGGWVNYCNRTSHRGCDFRTELMGILLDGLSKVVSIQLRSATKPHCRDAIDISRPKVVEDSYYQRGNGFRRCTRGPEIDRTLSSADTYG